jgi:hypothetical protein
MCLVVLAGQDFLATPMFLSRQCEGRTVPPVQVPLVSTPWVLVLAVQVIHLSETMVDREVTAQLEPVVAVVALVRWAVMLGPQPVELVGQGALPALQELR